MHEAPLFLRDLNPELKKETEEEIKNDRPDIVKAMELGQDVEIGRYYNTKDYKLI